jgi:RNA polymerase sigma factor (sigma-70 family)
MSATSAKLRLAEAPTSAPPASREASDLAALAERAVGGDIDAIRGLLQAVTPAVRTSCAGVLGPSHPELDDTVQESLVCLAQGLPSYRFECPIAYYAIRVAFYAALAQKRRSTRLRGLFVSSDEPYEWTSSGATLPSEQAILVESRKALDQVLGKLPDEQNEALLLRIVLGFSMDEICAITAAPLNTVKTRIRLAKHALRKHVERDPVLCSAIRRKP